MILDPALYDSLKNVQCLGSFSPETYLIMLNTPSVANIGSLNAQSKRTLSHEFGHLLHYSTSYFGLANLLYWAQAIDLHQRPPSTGTPEDNVTEQSRLAIAIARSKQVYSIDDEYYYERREELFNAARSANGAWSVRDVCGRLFTTQAAISDRHFWANRFFLGNGAATNDLSRSFLRIPVGIRTVLEHMARTIDFLGEMQSIDPATLSSQHGQQAGEPDLLHYYSLTHRVGPQMESKYGRSAVQHSYFVAGQLVAVLSEIPFQDSMTWQGLKDYAAKVCQDLAVLMTHPHPSFVFPLLLEAAFLGGIRWDNFDLDGMEGRADQVLTAMGLPSLNGLKPHRDVLFNQVVKTLNGSRAGQPLATLLQAIKTYSDALSWKDRLANPMVGYSAGLPVPLLFSDHQVLEGQILKVDACVKLMSIGKRYRELCQFPLVRDIVE